MSDTVHVSTLPRYAADVSTAEDTSMPTGARSRFPMDPEVNSRIITWTGELWRLDTDTVVNVTNESLTYHGEQSARLFEHAGPQLADECKSLMGIRTGEAKLTAGYGLPAKHVIHTVGPRFNIKYKTAAENCLHSSYWQCLEVMKENGLASIGFDMIHAEQKGYPTDAGAHIALRTVRRFVDKFGRGIDTIVFCFPDAKSADVYDSLLPLYFPRNPSEEAHAVDALPADIGNEFGETVIQERSIRIGESVLSVPVDEREPSRAPGERLLADADLSDISDFTDMHKNWTDGRSKQNERKIRDKVDDKYVEEEKLYLWYLDEAAKQDLSDIRALNIVYKSGCDCFGRMVVTIIHPCVPLDHERLLLYFVSLMDEIVERDYTLIYVCTRGGNFNRPSFEWLKYLYSVFSRKYKKNLKAMYVVHPTMWIKAAMLFLTPFVSKKFWKKFFYIEHVRELYIHIPPSQVVLPSLVMDYDLHRGKQ